MVDFAAREWDQGEGGLLGRSERVSGQHHLVFGPIAEDLNRVGERLLEAAAREEPPLAHVLSHPFSSPGKRLRPAVVLLSAEAAGSVKRLREAVITLAVAVETLHTATLIHDDIVDLSSRRRGKPTVGNLWGNRTAVFVGDYLFGKAASVVAEIGDVNLVDQFVRTLLAICDAEMHQSLADNRCASTKNYYRRIGGKTASLFALCAEGGAMLVEAPATQVKALHDYGYSLGMAFQIVDDILDFTGKEEILGKLKGRDLDQGVVTLPTIYFWQENPHHEALRHKSLSGKLTRRTSGRLWTRSRAQGPLSVATQRPASSLPWRR